MMPSARTKGSGHKLEEEVLSEHQEALQCASGRAETLPREAVVSPFLEIL